MTKVFDKEGNELTVGARVNYRGYTKAGDEVGEVEGPRWLQFGGWVLMVRWPDDVVPQGDPDPISVPHRLQPGGPVPDTYTAPDLLLIDSGGRGPGETTSPENQEAAKTKAASTSCPSSSKSSSPSSAVGSGSPSSRDEPPSSSSSQRSTSLASSPCSSAHQTTEEAASAAPGGNP